jgi:hypothetical protein
MRVVGRRKQEDVRLRMPTQAEVEANREASSLAPRVIPKGVYRYRSHEDANEAMERWNTDGLVEKALEGPGIRR